MQRMNMKCLGVLAMGCAAFAAGAESAGHAGTFDAVAGTVQVSNVVDPRPAATGSTLDSGDLVQTSDGSSARLHMADGALFELGAGTKFQVADYHYAGTGAMHESRAPATAKYDLKDGAVRTITGSIGKERGDNYMVTTEQADVRVHGTDYSMQESSGLLVICYAGSVTVSNDTGAVELSSGQYVYVASRRSPMHWKSLVDINTEVTVPTIIRLPPIPPIPTSPS
jgi:ferric-dicitrate binding protein FerR (iron transport regulator)